MAFESTRFSDIDSRARIPRIHESKVVLFVDLFLFFAVAIDLDLVFVVILVKHPYLLFLQFFLLGQFMFFPQYFFVEVLFREDVIDVVRGKVVPEEVIVYGGTHEDDSDFGVQADDPFDCEQNEVGVNVSLVDLVEDYEGVLFEDFRAVDHPLQEYSVGHEHYPIGWVDIGLHADLVADQIAFWNLSFQNAVQVHHSQSSWLYTYYL